MVWGGGGLSRFNKRRQTFMLKTVTITGRNQSFQIFLYLLVLSLCNVL